MITVRPAAAHPLLSYMHGNRTGSRRELRLTLADDRFVRALEAVFQTKLSGSLGLGAWLFSYISNSTPKHQ